MSCARRTLFMAMVNVHVWMYVCKRVQCCLLWSTNNSIYRTGNIPCVNSLPYSLQQRIARDHCHCSSWCRCDMNDLISLLQLPPVTGSTLAFLWLSCFWTAIARFFDFWKLMSNFKIVNLHTTVDYDVYSYILLHTTCTLNICKLRIR